MLKLCLCTAKQALAAAVLMLFLLLLPNTPAFAGAKNAMPKISPYGENALIMPVCEEQRVVISREAEDVISLDFYNTIVGSQTLQTAPDTPIKFIWLRQVSLEPSVARAYVAFKYPVSAVLLKLCQSYVVKISRTLRGMAAPEGQNKSKNPALNMRLSLNYSQEELNAILKVLQLRVNLSCVKEGKAGHKRLALAEGITLKEAIEGLFELFEINLKLNGKAGTKRLLKLE